MGSARALALSACIGAVSAGAASAALADDAVAGATMPVSASMQMAGSELFGRVLFDQLEWRHTDSSDSSAWEAQGWYGGDRNRLWVRTEGERSGGETEGARGELLWDHALGRWWNLQAGAREDFGGGPPRTWAAIGIEGLAPYWLDVEATLYVGPAGRTAARLKAEHDVLLTQRLILQPEVELNLYGRPDRARRLASGLSEAELGLRLRYEIRREFAPYVGVVWTRAAAAPQGGGPPAVRLPPGMSVVHQFQFAAGVRAWL